MYLVFPSLGWFGRLLRRPRVLLIATAVLVVLVVGGVQLWARYQYQAAKVAFEEGNLDDARDKLQICLWVWPGNTETLLLAARVERLDTNYAGAQRYLEQCKWWQNGVTEQTQLEWTLLRASAGGFPDAKTGLYAALAQNDPNAPYILETLAICYLRQGFYAHAMQALNQWLAQVPDSARALDLRAYANVEILALEDARNDFKKLMRVAPHNWKARLRYSTFLLDENNPDEAWSQLQILKRDHADNPEVMLNLSRYYFAKNRFDESREICNQLLEQHPDYWQAMFHLARLENQADNLAAAEHWARQALALESSRTDIHVLLYQVLKGQPGREKDAEEQDKRQQEISKYAGRIRKLVTEQLEKTTDNVDVYAELGDAYLHLGLTKTGLNWINAALAKNPGHKKSHEYLARYYEEQHQPKLAAKHRKLAQ